MILESSFEGKEIVPLWVDGRPLSHDINRLIEVYSSISGELISLAHSANVTEAIQAAESSWKSFQEWRNATAFTRRDLLQRVADIYEKRIDELTRYQMEETSCSEVFARFNVRYAQQALRETASRISSISGSVPQMESKDAWALVLREPIGPVLAIPPWNSSIILATRSVMTPIAAGCSVVFKASELCPRAHFAITEAFYEAGLPAGVLNQIQANRNDAAAVTEALISSWAIRKIEFIGSSTVGRFIGKSAAEHLKPVLMELGGKSPAIILEDASISRAAAMCAEGAFLHHGQICFSTERVIVLRTIAEQFKEALAAYVQEHHQKAGHAITVTGAKHACELLVDAHANGAKFLVGGPEMVGPASVRPTIVTNVTKECRIWDEETFGPSATLYIVDTEDEAVELANCSSFGLTAAIHTNNLPRALKLAKRLEYGQVHINSITEFEEVTAPVGGVKGSGWGRNNAHWGLDEFLVDKMVSIHGENSEATFG
ncbi:hypothetical protein N7520_011693 [Penicillium odoratum]|uniref:uncharacterized protein n=1 Tax=Penicillium odoratum TaxID=1167516 RepID=UPI0025487575|nr:uncharacterized protein N7520_011693 [Penicillium odoratum]KAJ5746511.1 hypothetical protein N7520_011693 [Penicillium odoratum]